MAKINEMNDITLLAYYRDTVINWWEDDYKNDSVYCDLLQTIETEIRKRMRG